MKNILTTVLAVILLAGCQSSQQMSLLPQTPAGSASARIFLFRPHRFAGDATAHGLYLDGQLVTQLASGDYTIFRVSPGSHMIAVKAEGGMGFDSQKVDCSAGEDYYFRATFSMALLSAGEGKQLVERLKFVESK
jgi:hypothetical protein